MTWQQGQASSHGIVQGTPVLYTLKKINHIYQVLRSVILTRNMKKLTKTQLF